MINIKLLSQDVHHTLRAAEYSDEEIAKMSAQEAFNAYCTWHGILGWASTLRRALESIEEASRDPR
jgi:hypothetical protein